MPRPGTSQARHWCPCHRRPPGSSRRSSHRQGSAADRFPPSGEWRDQAQAQHVRTASRICRWFSGWKKASCWPGISAALSGGNAFIEDGNIAGRGNILVDRIGKPDNVVRNRRTNARARQRQPPMLDVTLRNCRPAARRICLRARSGWYSRNASCPATGRGSQRRRSTDRSRAGEDTAGERLIWQPAIDMWLKPASGVDTCNCPVNPSRTPCSLRAPPGSPAWRTSFTSASASPAVSASPRMKVICRSSPGFRWISCINAAQGHRRLRCYRSAPAPDTMPCGACAEPKRPMNSRRLVVKPLASLSSVRTPCDRCNQCCRGSMRRSHCCRVVPAEDERRRFLTVCSQHPFHVSIHFQAAAFRALVANDDLRELDRLLPVNRLGQFPPPAYRPCQLTPSSRGHDGFSNSASGSRESAAQGV